MKIAFFSSKAYDKQSFTERNQELGSIHQLTFFDTGLSEQSVALAAGQDAVCVFVNDKVDATILRQLHNAGVNLLLLRCAGFNHVDLATAEQLDITVARVPAYSPHAVAELTLALLLSLNRKIHRAFNRVREGNFALDGLMGFDIHGKTVGLLGAGKIGQRFAHIMQAMGCRVLITDPYADPAELAAFELVELQTLLRESHIISLHCPLTPDTHHIINRDTLTKMRDGVTLINTSRGPMIDTKAVIEALKSGKIGSLGLDVYEEESDLFFTDLSNQVIQDDTFMRLLTFPNVLITGHQGFFTKEALSNIAETTLLNASAVEGKGGELHRVTSQQVV